jgi:acetolactate synthase-1/3 small subunit
MRAENLLHERVSVMRHVLSVLVANHAGVLSRVSGLFSRRGYNIDSLSVGATEDPRYSRITVSLRGDDRVIEQITKQVAKLVDVLDVAELPPERSVFRELCFIKVEAPARARSEIFATADIFRANIIDVSAESLTVEMTGDQGKIAAFIELMKPYGIMEIVRTGLTGIARGSDTMFIN